MKRHVVEERAAYVPRVFRVTVSPTARRRSVRIVADHVQSDGHRSLTFKAYVSGYRERIVQVDFSELAPWELAKVRDHVKKVAAAKIAGYKEIAE